MSEDSREFVKGCPVDVGGGPFEDGREAFRSRSDEVLDSALSGALERLVGKFGVGLSAEDLSKGLREVSILRILQSLGSESDGVGLKAAGMLLDRSDGKVEGEGSRGNGLGGLRLGGKVLTIRDDPQVVNLLDFAARRGAVEDSLCDVIDLEVEDG